VLRKKDMKFLVYLIASFMAINIFALAAETAEMNYFYSFESGLEIVVSADLVGPEAGMKPSVDWVECANPSDGFALNWTNFGDNWDIHGVKVSATNGGDLYVYEQGWEETDNPLILSEKPGKCFKTIGALPGGYRNPSVCGWTVEIVSCDSGDLPELGIMPMDNLCKEDFWVFGVEVNNCSNLCSMDLSFTLDCEICGEEDYELWELISQDSEACNWEILNADFVKEPVYAGGSCIIGYECYLAWETVSGDADFSELAGRTFGIGSSSPSYILPEPGVTNSGEIDGLGDWILYLGRCEVQGGSVMGSFQMADKPNDGLPVGDAFYFNVDLENSGNICEVDLYLYLQECDLDKGVWEFTGGSWEKIADHQWEVAGALPWRIEDTDYECRLHLFYPPPGQETDIPFGDDHDDPVFGVGRDDYFQPGGAPQETGEEVDDLMNGSCHVGHYNLVSLLLFLPLLTLFRKF